MIRILITALAVCLIFSSTVYADDLLVRIDSSSQETHIKLFDYLENGWTIWLLKATGSSAFLYGGKISQLAKGLSGELALGGQFDRQNGLRLKDILFKANLYYTRKNTSAYSLNELGGFLGEQKLWLWGEQEVAWSHKKCIAGLRAESFIAHGPDSYLLGPIIGRQYDSVRITLWPYRDLLEWSNYSLTIQAKGAFSY